MDSDELIRAYLDAWNRLDVAAILELMHPGAAYYDAFWAESCVGRDLNQYFRDSIDEEPFWYEKVGETITTEHGVAYRYSATQRSSPKPVETIYGAEILCLRDGKILTITDIYCNPDPSALRELVTLSAKHHGLTSHAQSGLSALKILRIRSNFSASLDIDRVYLDPNMTMSTLAEKVNCTLEQLTAVIEKQFGGKLDQILDSHRVEHAKVLLKEDTVDPEILKRVATSSGFASVAELKRKFLERVGVAPLEFVAENNPNFGNDGNSKLH